MRITDTYYLVLAAGIFPDSAAVKPMSGLVG